MTSPDPRSTRGTVAARSARVLVSFVMTLWLGFAGAQDLQVIELRHRLADDVIAALQPLVEPGGVLTGMDTVLFVRTSPANLEQNCVRCNRREPAHNRWLRRPRRVHSTGLM